MSRAVALSINGVAWMLLHELDKFDAEHQLAEEVIAFSPVAVAAMLGSVAAGVTHGHDGVSPPTHPTLCACLSLMFA